MIIEIPDENSIIKWKYKDNENWNSAEISDLIKAYERPQGEWKVYMKGYSGDKVINITYECNKCGRRISYVPTEFSVDKDEKEFLAKYPFCHCGAKMMKEENEDV